MSVTQHREADGRMMTEATLAWLRQTSEKMSFLKWKPGTSNLVPALRELREQAHWSPGVQGKYKTFNTQRHPVIPAPERQRQEDGKFWASLDYAAKLCLKKPKKLQRDITLQDV